MGLAEQRGQGEQNNQTSTLGFSHGLCDSNTLSNHYHAWFFA